MAARMVEARRRGALLRHAHVTRMAPKRAVDILEGGSLYWVIKGQISARQAMVGVEPLQYQIEAYFSFTLSGPETLWLTRLSPEASTWAMMLTGFAGLGFAAFRRGQRVKATFAA
jgi:hypothetical protein